VDHFDDSRQRVLASIAAVEAAERECLRATMRQVKALSCEAGLGGGSLVVFHAVPRGDEVWMLDDQDCSREDAVLHAVDLADVAGHRFRLTRSGLDSLTSHAALPRPGGSYGQCGHPGCRCFLTGFTGRHHVPFPPRPQTPPSASPLGGRLWQRAVLTWVDLHRALVTWTGRRLAASLVAAPETGDVASLDPIYCPDRGQDFEVVTSLRLSAESLPADDLEAALVTMFDESEGATPDLVELDLRRWMHGVGLVLPGFPAHGPGECESSAEER
jgi:hypothetical protein